MLFMLSIMILYGLMSVIMLSVIMLSVIMLRVILLSVIMPNVFIRAEWCLNSQHNDTQETDT